MVPGRRWTVRDRYGNDVYLTEERWQHIIDASNHPEMADYEAHVRDTLRTERRTQDALDPHKYRYIKAFFDLPHNSTHIVVIVRSRPGTVVEGRIVPNNYIVTAYPKPTPTG